MLGPLPLGTVVIAQEVFALEESSGAVVEVTLTRNACFLAEEDDALIALAEEALRRCPENSATVPDLVRCIKQSVVLLPLAELADAVDLNALGVPVTLREGVHWFRTPRSLAVHNARVRALWSDAGYAALLADE
jgi:ferredoxin